MARSTASAVAPPDNSSLAAPAVKCGTTPCALRGAEAIKKVCAQFVELCRKLGLLSKASVAIDGSKFKAVNNRDKNFTEGKIELDYPTISSIPPYRPATACRTADGRPAWLAIRCSSRRG